MLFLVKIIFRLYLYTNAPYLIHLLLFTAGMFKYLTSYFFNYFLIIHQLLRKLHNKLIEGKYNLKEFNTKLLHV
jgi:hypothetical protein